MGKYRWNRYTASESFNRLKKGENSWVSHGDFLDDWRRSKREDRLELVSKPLPEASTPEEKQWAALFVASIKQLCALDELVAPSWTKDEKYHLKEPWYPEAKSENMRRYLRETTPLIFAQHNVFGGDDILDRS